jgi:hypothetical protein
MSCQVFVDLAFQGRLRKGDDLVEAEIFLFTELLEKHGTAVLDTPGYCIIVPVEERRSGDRIVIWPKVRGVWTALWLEVRQLDVLVLYDR